MYTLRPPLCAATLTLAFAAAVPSVRAGTPALQPQDVATVSTLESQLMVAVNNFRAARGLRPFRVSAGLRTAARRHSGEMARHGYFAHSSPNGGPFWRRIAVFYPARGFRQWEVGENIEYGQPGLGAAAVLGDWLASPPHRANLVSAKYRDAGIGAFFAANAPGVFSGLPTTIVTLDVGRRRR